MHCTIRIGDHSLVVSECFVSPNDDIHSITVIDNWHATNEKDKPACKTIIVNSEPEAITMVQAFLEPDGPTEHYAKHFPEFC